MYLERWEEMTSFFCIFKKKSIFITSLVSPYWNKSEVMPHLHWYNIFLIYMMENMASRGDRCQSSRLERDDAPVLMDVEYHTFWQIYMIDRQKP